MKFNKFRIIGAKDGGKIELSKLWSTVYMTLSSTDALMRKSPSPNNGLMRFLVDTMNENAMFDLNPQKNLLETADGKYYEAVYGFMPRQARQTENGTFNPCGTDADTLKMAYDRKRIRYRHFSKKIKIPYGYVRCIKEGKMEYENLAVSEALRNYLDSLGRSVAKEVVEGGYIGKFAKGGGDTCKTLPLFKSNGMEVNPQGEIQLEEDMMQAETGQMSPVMIGGTRLSAYVKLLGLSTINTTTGVDLERLSAIGRENSYYRDTNVGINNKPNEGQDPARVLAIIPGALKLLTHARNEGDFEYEDDTQLRGTTVDPFYGLTHDYYINVNKCGQEVEYSIQFAIDWDILGYPDCWSKDEEFNGVTDVFCYTIDCSDDGVCGMNQAEGVEGSVPDIIEQCEDAYESCDVDCKAAFISGCEQLAVFSADALTAGNISGIKLNSMPFATTGGVYDISTEAGANGLLNDLQGVLKSLGFTKVLSGGWEPVGADAEYHVVADKSLLEVALINDSGADIELTRTEDFFVNVRDQSTVSDKANYDTRNLTYTGPNATVSGQAKDSIFSSETANYYGILENFFVLFSEGGSFTLDLSDDTGCVSTFTNDTASCAGLQFPVSVIAFDDIDGNDTDDGGPENALQNIKLVVYAGGTQTTVVDEIVTGITGEALFNLEAGTYNIDVDTTFGDAVGRTITTVRPKYIEVDVNGAIAWGPQWTENGKFPLQP